jgi:hypothetical protein
MTQIYEITHNLPLTSVPIKYIGIDAVKAFFYQNIVPFSLGFFQNGFSLKMIASGKRLSGEGKRS